MTNPLSMKLPEQALDAGSAAALPEGLRSELEALEEHGGAEHLRGLAAQLQELRKVASADLARVEADLQVQDHIMGRLEFMMSSLSCVAHVKYTRKC